jgi:hypothetical protein
MLNEILAIGLILYPSRMPKKDDECIKALAELAKGIPKKPATGGHKPDVWEQMKADFAVLRWCGAYKNARKENGWTHEEFMEHTKRLKHFGGVGGPEVAGSSSTPTEIKDGYDWEEIKRDAELFRKSTKSSEPESKG